MSDFYSDSGLTSESQENLLEDARKRDAFCDEKRERFRHACASLVQEGAEEHRITAVDSPLMNFDNQTR